MLNQPDRRFNLPPIAERLIRKCKSNKCKNARVDKQKFDKAMRADWFPFHDRLEYEKMKFIEMPKQYLVYPEISRVTGILVFTRPIKPPVGRRTYSPQPLGWGLCKLLFLWLTSESTSSPSSLLSICWKLPRISHVVKV